MKKGRYTHPTIKKMIRLLRCIDDYLEPECGLKPLAYEMAAHVTVYAENLEAECKELRRKYIPEEIIDDCVPDFFLDETRDDDDLDGAIPPY